MPAAKAVVARTSGGSTQTLLLHACPLPGPIAGLTAWTMTRVATASAADGLRAGLLLLALMLGMSAWLAWLLRDWFRPVGAVEAGLAQHRDDLPPALPRTGERDLDRIVDALNQAGQRPTEALAMTQRRDPVPELTDIGTLLSSCVERHADQAAAAQVRLAAEGAGTALLDASLIGRALDNLLSNAIRHTPPGGHAPSCGGHRTRRRARPARLAVRAVRDRPGGRHRPRPRHRAGVDGSTWRPAEPRRVQAGGRLVIELGKIS